MKNFKEFLLEDLRPIGSSYTLSSTAQTASKKDVLKKSKNDVYHDLEFEVHEMMKKRTDLFCKILKNSKQQVLMEKLDTRTFVKDFENITDLFYNLSDLYKDNKSQYYYQIRTILKSAFHDTKSDYEDVKELFKRFGLNEKTIYDDIINCEKNCNKDENNDIKNKILIHVNNFDNIFKFTKNFIHLKLNIYEYFEKFLGDDNDKIYTDLHSGNFGYIKGTKEIRCFDPIVINIRYL